MTDSPQPRSRSWRKLLIDLHLYSGLLMSPYLVIYGVSSLQFNHTFAFMEGPRATVEWERAVPIPTSGDDLEIAEVVRDELGLVGWPAPWTFQRDAGDLRFDLARPGRSYTIQTRPSSGTVVVVESRQKIWSILAYLHGGGRVPRAPILTLWWVFTCLSVVVVLFGAVTGVYLWWVSGRERVMGWSSVGLASVSFFGFVAYLVL